MTLVARREDRLKELATELERSHGVAAGYVAADLTDPTEWKRVAESVAERDLEVEILANNAGFGTFGPFHKLDPERELEEVRLNCEAVVALSSAYLPQMVERGRGAILNVASVAAFQPQPFNAIYAATKAFVLSFSEAIHAELAGTGVTVTAVCPGPVDSEFYKASGSQDAIARAAAITMSSSQCAETALRALELGRRNTIPGWPIKLVAFGSRSLPTSIKLPVAKRFLKNYAQS